MKSLQLFIGVVCLNVFIGKSAAKNERKITTLMAGDDPANNEKDVLTITCEGGQPVLTQEDIDTGKFHLQIRGLPAAEKETKNTFERELFATGAESGGNPSTGFSVKFPYTDTANSDIIKEILKRKIELNLVIFDAADTGFKSSVRKNATLLDIENEFPSGTAVLKYIADSHPGTGRWIRIGEKTTSKIIGGSIDIPVCELPPCYTYESSFDDGTTKYHLCEDVTMDIGDNIYLCSSEESSSPKDLGAPKEDDVPDQIILDHANKLEVILADAKLATKVDLVVHKPDEQPTRCPQGLPITADLTDPVECGTITIDVDMDEYKILLVGYEGENFKWANDYLSNNHKIRAKMLSTDLLEALWDHTANGDTQQYLVKRSTKDGDTGLVEAYVDCSAIGGTDCTSFFFGVPVDGSYTVTIQDVTKFNDGKDPELNPVSVRSDVATTLKAEHKNQIVIHQETIKTEVIDNNMIIEVCFENLKNISMKDFYYEFLIVNSKGQWKRERKLNMKSDSYSCFHPVEAAISDFKENSKALVLLRNTNDRNVLASAEVKFQVPEAAIAHTGDNSGNASSNTVWIIVGTSAGFLACLVALVALIYTKIIKRGERDDGIQYPLQRNIIENSKIIQGLDNPASTI